MTYRDFLKLSEQDISYEQYTEVIEPMYRAVAMSESEQDFIALALPLIKELAEQNAKTKRRSREEDSIYGLQACMESVETSVYDFHENPFEQLGRSIIRAKQDVFFNKTMIDAWLKFFEDNDLKWNTKITR
ncbi:MAG: hypothetical protein LUH08_02510 [Ruminococcus sp.]|nr:hypothetical protein [Ruminococcus sp.]